MKDQVLSDERKMLIAVILDGYVPCPDGVQRSLRAVIEVQFREDIGDVIAHSCFANRELLGNIFVR